MKDASMETATATSTTKSTSPKRRRHQRFDLLAQQKGWNDADLRKCFDLPKNILSVGSKIIKMPSAILEDPFKNRHYSDLDQEYEALETRFYNKLSKMTIPPPQGKRDCTQNHVRIKITGDEGTNGMQFNVNKQSVDTRIVSLPRKSKKK